MTTYPIPVFGAQVRDGLRLLTFDGHLLASISSRDSVEKDRWTEMRCYKTQGGSFVLEKVGRSIRLHVQECPDILKDLPLFEQAHPGEDPEEGYSWCSICSPAIGEEYDITTLRAEVDRYWATISTDPAVIIDALYRKREGYTRLPRISVQLLTDLCEVDPAFEIWRTEKVS